MDKKSLDRFFMMMFLIIGVLLFGISANTFDKLSRTCTASVVYDSVLGVLVIGGILITMAVAYFFCADKNLCYNSQNTEGSESLSQFYLIASFLFSFLITVLLLAAGSKLSSKPECNTPGVKTNIWFMFSLSLVCLLLSGFGLYSIFKKKELLLKN